MKKLLALVALLAILLLSGCVSKEKLNLKGGRFIETTSNQWFNIVVDTYTGVNYLLYHADHIAGMSPLYDAEGNVIITPVN